MKNELLKILEKEHRGKDRAIVSRKLEERLGCRGTLLRETVNELRCSGIPICSDNKNGYYLARTYEELAETVEQLKSRVKKIQSGIDGLKKVKIGKGEDYDDKSGV